MHTRTLFVLRPPPWCARGHGKWEDRVLLAFIILRRFAAMRGSLKFWGVKPQCRSHFRTAFAFSSIITHNNSITLAAWRHAHTHEGVQNWGCFVHVFSAPNQLLCLGGGSNMVWQVRTQDAPALPCCICTPFFLSRSARCVF